MGNAQIHSVIQENYNRDLQNKRPSINSNEHRSSEPTKNESVIVIDSDSDVEKDLATSASNRGNHAAFHASTSPKSGSSTSSRPGSTGGPTPGVKPPPLTVVTSATNKTTRTTATVTPLSQSASTVTVTSGNSGNHAMAATRTSSFAAALRKLAKQATDNGPEDGSPRASPASTTPHSHSAASTPASNKNFHLQPSPLMVPASSTPPVVTIAPTHTASTHTNSEVRRELDRHVTSNSIDHRRDRLSTESNNTIPAHWRGKDSPGGAPRSVYSPSRPVPTHPKPDEPPHRGFQPYRHGHGERGGGGEEIAVRPSVPPAAHHPPHLTYDPSVMAAAVSASYPFHPAFMSPAHLQYSAFRPEEHYERYGYPGLRPPFLPFASPHSQLFPHAAAAAMSPLFPGLRYPSDLAMPLSHVPPGMAFGGLMSPSHHDREKLLQAEQREKERKAEEAKHEAALKEKQREAEREAHERAMAASRNDDRGHNSPRGLANNYGAFTRVCSRHGSPGVIPLPHGGGSSLVARNKDSTSQLRTAPPSSNFTGPNVTWSSFSRVSRTANHYGQHRLMSSMQTAPPVAMSKLHSSQGANLNQKDSSRSQHHSGHHHSNSPHHSNSSSSSPRVSAHSHHHSSVEAGGAVPLLKKAPSDHHEDRWQQNRQSVLVSGKDAADHLNHHGHNSADLHHRQNRLAQSLHDSSHHSSKPMNLIADRDKKVSHHDRSLLLQQDRNVAERHEKEKTLLREQHRDQMRMDQGSSVRPLSLRSPHGRGEEPFRSKLFKDHRTGHSDHHIPNQYEYDRLPPQQVLDRTLHKDKAIPNAHDKAWLEQRRAALGHEGTSSMDRDLVHENNGPHHPIPTSGKVVQLNQYDYDKPNAEFSYHLHEFYRKNQLRGPGGDFPRNVPASEPVVSKLDLEEKKRREVRMSGIYVSSSSESDSDDDDDDDIEEKRERYRRRMERIATRSNLPLDKSEGKIDFFMSMGLTTQGTKMAINREQRRKRRKLLHEDSPVPAKIARTSSPKTSLPPVARLSQEDFQRELDYPHKCRFLCMFGLEVVTPEKRRQMEKEKAIVEGYRQHWHKRKSDAAGPTGKENIEKTEDKSKTNSGPDEPPQLTASTTLKVPGIVPNHLASALNLHTQTPIHVPRERNFSPHTQTQKHPKMQQHQQQQQQQQQSSSLDKVVQPLQNRQLYDTKDIKKEPLLGERGDRKGCAVEQSPRLSSFSTAAILSSSSSSSSRSKPFEGFAQEFHQSVLRSTQEALANQRAAGQSSHGSRSSDSPRREMHVNMSTSSSSPQSLSSSGSSCISKVQKPAPFMWPGVEGVMDAYQRHVSEQMLERRILQDQLGRLRMKNTDMTSMTEQLRLRVNDLHNTKQSLHRDQDLYMRDIHLLKQTVLDLRK